MANEGGLAKSLAEVAGLVVGERNLQQTLHLVAGLAVQAVDGVDGAGVTWVAAGAPTTVSATADFVRRVDALQYRFGQGPCLSAVEIQRVVLAPMLSADPRWPRFAVPALHAGVAGAVAIPLIVAGAVLGALNLYARRPGVLDDVAASAGAVFAAQAAFALANAQAFDAATTTIAQLETALVSRAIIDQAKGVLMQVRHCTAEEAFDGLVRASQSRHLKLREIATLVVDAAAAGGRIDDVLIADRARP